VTAHIPLRPGWLCAGCGGHWPCGPRQRQLRAEYSGVSVSLAMFLAACMVEAAHDMPQAMAGQLYERFLGWVRHQPAG
jgi:hypothetical protein